MLLRKGGRARPLTLLPLTASLSLGHAQADELLRYPVAAGAWLRGSGEYAQMFHGPASAVLTGKAGLD
jgi:hypothetical protein